MRVKGFKIWMLLKPSTGKVTHKMKTVKKNINIKSCK